MAAPLMIAQIGFMAMGAMQQMKAAKQAESMTTAAAIENYAREQTELTRQQKETNRVAAEEKSDRQREWDKDLGTVRAARAEGFAMGDRLVGEVAYLGGLDLSRIEGNRAAQSAALQSQKSASNRNATDTIAGAKARGKAQRTSAFLGALGSGVQIGAKHQHRQTMIDLEKNRER